jgi:hypothetical protein
MRGWIIEALGHISGESLGQVDLGRKICECGPVQHGKDTQTGNEHLNGTESRFAAIWREAEGERKSTRCSSDRVTSSRHVPRQHTGRIHAETTVDTPFVSIICDQRLLFFS